MITSLDVNPVATRANLDAARFIIYTIEKDIGKENSLIDTKRSMEKLTINLDLPTNELHNPEHKTLSSTTCPSHVPTVLDLAIEPVTERVRRYILESSTQVSGIEYIHAQRIDTCTAHEHRCYSQI